MALVGLGGPSCTPNGTPNLNFLAAPGMGALAGLFSIVFPGYILNTRESWSQALTSTNHGRNGCEFFNPYLTSLSNPALANSPALLDWMTDSDILRANKRNQMEVIDMVVSGELFEIKGGMAQFALGYQHRDQRATGKAPEINLPGLRVITGYGPGGLAAQPNQFASEITNNLECSGCIFNFDDERSVDAVFLELSLPIVENVETQVALRWEDYGGNIGSDISPKVALSWRPIEELLLRGSYSQSFRAPNIGVVNQAFESFGTTVLDPIRNQSVRAGLLPAINANGIANGSFTIGQPNPNLENETADTYNIGFQWTPSGSLEGFSLGADIWRFEVEGRVLPKIPRSALDPEIENFNLAAQNPANYILNNTIPLDARGPNGLPVSCDPRSFADQASAARRNCVVNPTAYVTDGVQRNMTDTNASLITLVLPAINAGKFEVQGIDFRAGYTWDNDWGSFRVGVDYTHVDEYLVSDVPGLEAGFQSTGVFDAAGVDGEQNIVREVPDNKGTLSFSWSSGNHRLSLFNRHIGSYQVLSHRQYLANPQTTPLDKSYAKSSVASYDTWDIQYNYNHEWANSALGSTGFTFGVIDLMDEDLPLFRRSTFDAAVFDGRGRRLHARALWQF